MRRSDHSTNKKVKDVVITAEIDIHGLATTIAHKKLRMQARLRKTCIERKRILMLFKLMTHVFLGWAIEFYV
jgi:hypothetical protein